MEMLLLIQKMFVSSIPAEKNRSLTIFWMLLTIKPRVCFESSIPDLLKKLIFPTDFLFRSILS